MDNIKDKYSMRFFLSTGAFLLCFACVFLAIWYLETILIIIPLVLLDVILFFKSYQILMYRLALRKKFEVKYEGKIKLNEYFDNKVKKRDSNLKVIDKLLTYSLYASPIILILSIALGIFVTKSVVLAIVIPSLVLVYLIALFFIKDIYSSIDYIEEKELKEIVYINSKTITYKGCTYIFNYCGFHFKGDSYKFLFIPLSKPKFSDEVKEKIEGARSDSSK